MEERNPWKTLSEKTAYETPWFRVKEHKVIDPAGNEALYSYSEMKYIAVGVLPLDNENNTWMVGQWRYPIGKYTWEMPEGGGDPKLEPLESAKRELFEEAGIKADKWLKIQDVYPGKSSMSERAVLFIARDLEYYNPQPDEAEELKLKKVPFDDLYNDVINGNVIDALTVIAVLHAKHLMNERRL